MLFLAEINALVNLTVSKALITEALNRAFFNISVIREQLKKHDPKARSFSIVSQLINI